MTDEMFNEIFDQAVQIQAFIYHNGGMATKTVVEDVLMNMYPVLDRYQAHTLLNRVECEGRTPRLVSPPDIESIRPYMTGVDMKWYRGNPFRPE